MPDRVHPDPVRMVPFLPLVRSSASPVVFRSCTGAVVSAGTIEEASAEVASLTVMIELCASHWGTARSSQGMMLCYGRERYAEEAELKCPSRESMNVLNCWGGATGWPARHQQGFCSMLLMVWVAQKGIHSIVAALMAAPVPGSR